MAKEIQRPKAPHEEQEDKTNEHELRISFSFFVPFVSFVVDRFLFSGIGLDDDLNGITEKQGMEIELGGHSLVLLPARAVWWPDERAVVVADVHLGKDQVFRRSGIAIPEGVLDDDLAALGGLIDATAAERLVILGDWVHAPPVAGDRWTDRITDWRAAYRDLEIDLVLGNHDRGLETWLEEWRIEGHLQPLEINSLKLLHDAGHEMECAALSGHVHPVARLRSGCGRHGRRASRRRPRRRAPPTSSRGG